MSKKLVLDLTEEFLVTKLCLHQEEIIFLSFHGYQRIYVIVGLGSTNGCCVSEDQMLTHTINHILDFKV